MGIDALLTTLELRAATPATPAKFQGLQQKPMQYKAVTPATPATPEKGNATSEAPALDPCASRRWLVQFPDLDPVELTCCPPATRAQILEGYPGAIGADPYQQPPTRAPDRPLTDAEGASVRAWLDDFGEDDPATRAQILERCEGDAEARAYFIRRAGEVPGADTWDDRRTCRQCVNLTRAGQCLAAGRGDLVTTARAYRPPPDRLHRCEGYAPGTEDPDRRSGRERWPGLMQPRAD